MSERFRAVYRVASYLGVEKAAEVLAGEQSSGTFMKLSMETDDLLARHGARIESIEREAELPSALPGAQRGTVESSLESAIVTIAFPVENIGVSIVTLLNTVAGNLYELRELAAVKLLDVEIPPGFAARYPGPRHGIAGTHRLIGKTDTNALIGTIVKPSVGLSIDQLRSVVRQLARAGIDFIKDDELQADPAYAPLAERIPAVMEEIERAADITGKKTMFAFNISDEIDTMRANHDRVLAAGGTCVMATIPTVGLPGIKALADHSALPVHGHRSGFGALMRSDAIGIGFVAYQKLARLAGVDHLHVGGIDSKFFEANASVVGSIRAIQAPLFDTSPIFPVLSAGQSAATAQKTHDLVADDRLMVLAGGGISGHPEGIAAGVAAMQDAWAAIAAGEPVAERARRDGHEALSRALDHFGPRAC